MQKDLLEHAYCIKSQNSILWRLLLMTLACQGIDDLCISDHNSYCQPCDMKLAVGGVFFCKKTLTFDVLRNPHDLVHFGCCNRNLKLTAWKELLYMSTVCHLIYTNAIFYFNVVFEFDAAKFNLFYNYINFLYYT